MPQLVASFNRVDTITMSVNLLLKSVLEKKEGRGYFTLCIGYVALCLNFAYLMKDNYHHNVANML